MKQPALGQKIAELRKAKGLTQEELVERCNISVRTIQRIETGEVTPRSFTLKTILAVLETDFEKIVHHDESTGDPQHRDEHESWWRNIAGTNEELLLMPRYTVHHLNLALIGGVLYLVLSFIEAPIEFMRYTADRLIVSPVFLGLLKIVMFAAIVLFLRGFVITATLYDNYLLRIGSLLMVATYGLLNALDLTSLVNEAFDVKMFIAGVSFLFGVTGIVFGIALRRLEQPLGRTAEIAGIVEIVSGCFFLSIVFSIAGDFLHVVAEVFGIALLFKVQRLQQKRQRLVS